MDIRDLFECWNWTGSTTNGGYGVMNISQKIIRATRMSYELNKGKIPEGLFVLHHCDNPLCVNPTHLFLGNDSDLIVKRYIDFVGSSDDVFVERNNEKIAYSEIGIVPE